MFEKALIETHGTLVPYCTFGIGITAMHLPIVATIGILPHIFKYK
jgi:hypothetical protein